MLDWFDYIFYRVTRFYKRRWVESFQERYGICALSLAQIVTIVDLMLLLKTLFGGVVFEYFPKAVFVAVMLSLIAYNFYRHLKIVTYEKLDEKWSDEDPGRSRRNGALVVLYLVTSISIPFAYGIIGHFSKAG